MTIATAAPETAVAAIQTFRRQNAALLAQLGKAIMDDASILAGIPNGAMLVLLPTDADREFVGASITTGIDMIGKGHNVYFRYLEPGEWGIDFAAIAKEDAGLTGGDSGA